jgi:hypothetical protein
MTMGFVGGQNYLVFSMKVPRDGLVALSAGQDNLTQYMYELVFGGWQNTASAIR